MANGTETLLDTLCGVAEQLIRRVNTAHSSVDVEASSLLEGSRTDLEEQLRNAEAFVERKRQAVEDARLALENVRDALERGEGERYVAEMERKFSELYPSA